MGQTVAEMGVGLIGYGLGGRVFHAPFVQTTSGMALRAIVSRDPAKVHASLPGAIVMSNVDALLAHPGIDLVLVPSPDALHAQHAIAAFEAGKHVLVDGGGPLLQTLMAMLVAERGESLAEMPKAPPVEPEEQVTR